MVLDDLILALFFFTAFFAPITVLALIIEGVFALRDRVRSRDYQHRPHRPMATFTDHHSTNDSDN